VAPVAAAGPITADAPAASSHDGAARTPVAHDQTSDPVPAGAPAVAPAAPVAAPVHRSPRRHHRTRAARRAVAPAPVLFAPARAVAETAPRAAPHPVRAHDRPHGSRRAPNDRRTPPPPDLPTSPASAGGAGGGGSGLALLLVLGLLAAVTLLDPAGLGPRVAAAAGHGLDRATRRLERPG
jgi:hypothetical protein